ncbi:hypothetical protein L917_07138 [Phytophthora nicotianae]|uniref:Uncharacterized protein n=1 Tax=Phytophthora nicotianae TaxID=4792 RepID=W2LE86_PHYNI|nr:hypothetical protein L917_07138 [Phytophthora nicotianae]
MRAILSVLVGSLGIQLTAAILNGQVVSPDTKTYATGVRTRDGDSYCGGALRSSSHILTTALTTTSVLLWLGRIIAKSSEQFRHPDVGFAHVKLPKANDSGINPGMLALSIGWGVTINSLLAAVSNELRSDAVEVWNNGDCKKVLRLDGAID